MHHHRGIARPGVPVVSAFGIDQIPPPGTGAIAGAVVMNTTIFDGLDNAARDRALWLSMPRAVPPAAACADWQSWRGAWKKAWTRRLPSMARAVRASRGETRTCDVFHIGVEKAHTLEKAWDLMAIPHLFSRAVIVSAPLIPVSPNADTQKSWDASMPRCRQRSNASVMWPVVVRIERGGTRELREEWNA